VDEKERERLKEGYGYYVETLTMSVFDGPQENQRFCIGGMSCEFSCFCSLIPSWRVADK